MVGKHEQDTKKKITDAAYKVLAELGYDNLSMKQIAAEAGVAQGLINYYFASKEQLLFELFKEVEQEYSRYIQSINDIPFSDHFVEQALRIPSELAESHPEWHRIRFELFAIGMRSKAGMKQAADNLRYCRNETMRLMERLPIDPNTDREGIASLLVAAIDGIALQKITDPEFDADKAYGVLGRLLGSLLKPE